MNIQLIIYINDPFSISQPPVKGSRGMGRLSILSPHCYCHHNCGVLDHRLVSESLEASINGMVIQLMFELFLDKSISWINISWRCLKSGVLAIPSINPSPGLGATRLAGSGRPLWYCLLSMISSNVHIAADSSMSIVQDVWAISGLVSILVFLLCLSCFWFTLSIAMHSTGVPNHWKTEPLRFQN